MPAPRQEDPTARGSMFQRVRLVGLFTFLSRILGLGRDAVMATQFGNGVIMDAFTVAFRVPNMVRQIFGEGALSTAFLPVFIRDIEQNGKQTAYQTATAVLVVTTISLLAVVILFESVLLGIWLLVPLEFEAKLLLELTAILAPYLMLICVLAQACAVLNGLGVFGIPALFPVLLNCLWIILAWAVWRAIPDAETRIAIIAGGIVVVGIFQIGLCIPTLLQIGFRFDWNWSKSRSRVQTVLTTMAPVVLGLSITQMNTLCDSLIAWGLTGPSGSDAERWLDSYPLSEGTAAAMYLGQRLYQFPVGVFAVALGTVIYPLLTTHAERGQLDLFREDLVRGLRLVIAITVPASIGLILISTPLTRLLFERGEFNAQDTIQTSAMIAAYGPGVWAACGLLIISRGWYALGDRRTPLRIGLVSVLVNLVANLSLVWVLGGPGLAIATSLTVTFQVFLSACLIARRVEGFRWSPILDGLIRTCLATTAMGVTCVISSEAISYVQINSILVNKCVQLFVPLLAGTAIFFVSARILHLREPFDLLQRKPLD